MSNLKNNFTSKLTSVVKTSAKRGFVYTASFEDGTTGVIRTSGREYVSVTQISTWYDDGRTDFLFSSKPTAALGKNEQGRVMAVVQVTSPAPKPTDKELAAYQPKIVTDAITNALRPAPEPVHEITKASATTAGWIEDAATGNVRGVIRQYGKVIWIEPTHSTSRQEAVAKAQAQLGDIAPEPVKGEKAFEHNGVAFTIAPDFKGTHGWRWYIEQPAVGRSIRSERAYLCEERAIFEAKLQIDEQHRLEHSGDGDCDRHPLG